MVEKLKPVSYNSIQFLIGLVILTIFNLFTFKDFNLNFAMLISGLLGGIQLFLLNKAFENVNNPALPIALFRTQIIVTSILGWLFYKNPISHEMIIYMIIIIIGALLIAYTRKNNSNSNKQNSPKNKLINNKISSNKNWQLYVMISIICVAISDILMKQANSSLSKNSMISNCWNFLIAATSI